MHTSPDSLLDDHIIGYIWKRETNKLGILECMIRAGPIALSSYLEQISALKSLFRGKLKAACCIDEGSVPREDDQPISAVRSAGVGVLTGNIDLAADQIVRFPDVRTVITHEECGAARMALAERNNKRPHEVSQNDVNNFAWDWGKELAERVGSLLGVEVQHKYHSLREMNRWPGLHPAVVAYYDGSGNFNRAGISELPRGFVISRSAMSPDRGIENLRVAANIALGEHGFAERFTPERPFGIIAIGNPADEDLDTDRLIEEAEEAVKHFNGQFRVLGFEGLTDTNTSV